MKATISKRARPARGIAPKSAASAKLTTWVPSVIQIRTILVPTDFSPSSKKALKYAVRFAEQFGAKLTLLFVVEPALVPDFASPLVMENDKMMKAAREKLEWLRKKEKLEPRLVERTLVRLGPAHHEITSAARSLKADLIVISTHGYTGVKHVLLGSTTERVVRHAPCPVLVVREKEHEFVAN